MKAQAQFIPTQGDIDTLRSAALFMTRDVPAADDLVQDTLVRAVRFWRTYDAAKGSVRGWLRAILWNSFKNSSGDEERRCRHIDAFRGAGSFFEARIEDPESAFVREEQAARVRAAVDAIPERYRAALVMCDFKGMSYAEIAEALNCPIGTVMSKIHRGRRSVEASLQNG